MNITNEDREAAYRASREMDMTLLAKSGVLAEHFARCRIAAYRQGIDDAAGVCENECPKVVERNAIARRIRKLAIPPR